MVAPARRRVAAGRHVTACSAGQSLSELFLNQSPIPSSANCTQHKSGLFGRPRATSKRGGSKHKGLGESSTFAVLHMPPSTRVLLGCQNNCVCHYVATLGRPSQHRRDTSLECTSPVDRMRRLCDHSRMSASEARITVGCGVAHSPATHTCTLADLKKSCRDAIFESGREGGWGEREGGRDGASERDAPFKAGAFIS